MKHISSFLSFIIVFLLSACHNKENYSDKGPIETDIMRVECANSVTVNTYVGKVEESTSLQLRFPLGGKVNTVNVKKGQRVRQGELIATIDDTQQRNALKAAQATLNQAQDAYERLKHVYEEGALAEVKWIDCQTKLQTAKAATDAAQQQLKDCKLYAPQSGIIEECDLRTGQQLLPGQTAVKLINTDGVQIVFPVPETEISTINTGDKAEIIVPALNDLRLEGTIGEKDMLGNSLTHSYNVKIQVPNKGNMLMSGMMCKVSCTSSKTAGYIIPAKCVQTMQNGISVWVVKNGTAHRQTVASSAYVKGGILIDNGLEEGDTVITSGYQKLYEGARVKGKQE